MQKLIRVEEAKTLMNVAKDWSVWHWLLEKKRVRAAADAAVDALNELDRQVKAGWNDNLKRAYRELEAEAALNGTAKSRRQYEKARDEAAQIDFDTKAAVKRVKEADDVAEEARLDAEATFDEAERRLSADLARQGAQKAIDSWGLREKAIRRAETLARRTSPA